MSKQSIEQLLTEAVKRNASDLHLVVGRPPVFRIDGVLMDVDGAQTLTPESLEAMAFAMLSDKSKEVLINERELDVSYEIDNVSRYRVNMHWEKNNLSVAARVISNTAPTMAQLLLPDVVYDLVRLNQGLILVTGPTGSGKSTTLAAMIDLINSERTANIITLEDPIEFAYKMKKSIIRQRQLGTDMLSFAQALKHIVRQDPNVILVGEMRDLETIAATITLAETGHLVLATLHTFSAAQTVDRIIDVFPPHQQNQVRLQLSLFLKGIIAQQLLPRRKDAPTIGDEVNDPNAAQVSKGRIASREILINTPAIANLIRENKIAQVKAVIQTGGDLGMITMDQSVRDLYKGGFITKETAIQYVQDADLLE